MNSIQENIPSKVLANAVAQFSKLPGIGKKTAIRLVLHLIKQDKDFIQQFSESISNLYDKIQFCTTCHCISDSELCEICMNPGRSSRIICIVQDFRDMISIESTGQFHGKYHILGGVISPLDGIGPDALNISSLISRCKNEDIEELIMALSPNIEGDTTLYYISKQLQNEGLSTIKLTSIARGISFGTEIEYTDELTLGKAINKRLPIDNYVNNRD